MGPDSMIMDTAYGILLYVTFTSITCVGYHCVYRDTQTVSSSTGLKKNSSNLDPVFQ